MVIKTTRAKLAALEAKVLDEHLYDTPEVISLLLHSSNGKYLNWLMDSVR